MGLDLLAGPGLFGRAWPRLVAGYVTDAIDREPGPWQLWTPGPVLEALTQGQAELGLGEECRLRTRRVPAPPWSSWERVVHLMAFPAPEVNQ